MTGLTAEFAMASQKKERNTCWVKDWEVTAWNIKDKVNRDNVVGK